MFNVSVREPFPLPIKRSQSRSRLAPLIGLLRVNGVYVNGDPVGTWPSTAEEGMIGGTDLFRGRNTTQDLHFQTDTRIARPLSEFQRALSPCSLGSVEAAHCQWWHSQHYSAPTVAWSLQSR